MPFQYSVGLSFSKKSARALAEMAGAGTAAVNLRFGKKRRLAILRSLVL
jgi:hypothetical protein